MKINISISKDGEKFEEFAGINFNALDGLSVEEQKDFIEDYCKTAVQKIVEKQFETKSTTKQRSNKK
jgi:hypothetical protein